MSGLKQVQKDLQELYDGLDNRIRGKDDKFWLGVWTGIKYALQKCKHPDKSFDLFLDDSTQVDDKPEEFWASMDGRHGLPVGSNPSRHAIQIWEPDCRPSWRTYEDFGRGAAVGRIEVNPLMDIPGLQPGMLCKVKKVGEDNYKIISVKECHLPIEVEWRRQDAIGAMRNPNVRVPKNCFDKWGHCVIMEVPCLPGTDIQITCPFKKKVKCHLDYCPQCGRPAKEPSDNFCRHCGTSLKELR